MLVLLRALVGVALCSFALRLGLAASQLLHEYAHLVCAIACARLERRGGLQLGIFFTAANLCGHIPPLEWLASLSPFLAPLPSSLAPHVSLPAHLPPFSLFVARHAGWLFSLLFAATASSLLIPLTGRGWGGYPAADPLVYVLLGCWLTAAGALSSDLCGILPSEEQHCLGKGTCASSADSNSDQHAPAVHSGHLLFCGNFGALLADLASSSVDAVRHVASIVPAHLRSAFRDFSRVFWG